MDVLGGLIGIAFFIGIFFVIGRIISSISSSIKNKTTNTYGRQTSTLGVLSTRVSIMESVPEDGPPMTLFKVEARGPLPSAFPGGLLSVTTSIIDVTDENDPMPVHTGFDRQQEKNSRIFLEDHEHGTVGKDLGYNDWSIVGVALIDALDPPHSGNRKLRFLSRWVHPAVVDRIHFGVIEDTNAMYGYSVANYTYRFPNTGYVERHENEIRSQEISVILAVNIAMTDNELHDAEGTLIKNFIQKFVGTYSGELAEDLKERMNAAMKRGYGQATSGRTNVEQLTSEMAEIGAQIDIYELMELLIDVMASDSLAHRDQVSLINAIGKGLGVTSEDIQQMKDKRTMSNDGPGLAHEDLEGQLGIDPSMSNDEILKYLRTEFIQWNGRLGIASDASQKAKIQERLNLIGEARQKYELQDAA